MKIGNMARFLLPVATLSALHCAFALSLSPRILPVSDGVLTLGEWNSNFDGARAVADAYNVPLLVFYGGLSCGKCEELQRACLTEEFLTWQASRKMLFVFTTNNSRGDASGFARPEESTGFPFMAVYWNRSGEMPQKNSDGYRTFNGRDGEMLVKGGTLANQLIGSIEAVAGDYDFTRKPDISANAELLYVQPVTTRIGYSISLFTGLDAANALEPQKVYNLKESGKPKLKKVSGDLPKGVKLVYDGGFLKLSGAAKTAGSRTYVFSIQQKSNGVLHVGPDITLDFDVIAANDASRGGCAMLNQALKATVPLFSQEASGKVMKGTLDLVATARNMVRAKYVGLGNAKSSFSGKWSRIDGGVARAELEAGGRRLTVELEGDGAVRAVFADPSFAEPLTSLDGLKVGTGSFASAFGGCFTVSLAESSGQSGTGCGYLCIKKVTPAGKVSWSGMLGNGQNVSGSAFAMVDSSGCGNVAVFKCSSKDYVAMALKIRPNDSSSENQRAVVTCEGTVPRWAHHVAPASVHDCMARGSRYSKGLALDECCASQFSATPLTLSAVTDGFTSGRYGAVASSPTADVTVTADRLTLATGASDVKMTFAKATGVFKGSMKVAFESGAATVKFAGVVIPGWHDCGCAPIDTSDPFRIDASQPFAIGTAWFADSEGGVAAKRGFTVKIDEKAY